MPKNQITMGTPILVSSSTLNAGVAQRLLTGLTCTANQWNASGHITRNAMTVIKESAWERVF